MDTQTANDAQAVVVAEIAKNYHEKVVVSVGAYRGTPLAQLRIWFRAEDGSWRPSKSGIAIRPALLPELAEAIQCAIECARRIR